MTYLKVTWKHSKPGYPVVLYSELNERRWEVRKVEVFRDGRRGYANSGETAGPTRLGETPIPPLIEIASNSEFEPIEITKGEFEEIWSKRVQAE